MMEKYGVMKEYVCECGCTITVPGNNSGKSMVKKAEKKEVMGHVHKFKEVKEDSNDSR